MSDLYAYLGLRPFEIDPQKLAPMGPPESDSHYRMKFPHTQSTHMTAPPKHEIPARIQARIEDACSWYYRVHYPQWSRSTQ
jgi:sulfotransferase